MHTFLHIAHIYICYTYSLKDALRGFVYERANSYDEDRATEIMMELPDLPEEVQVQHAAKTWTHIWERCHIYLQDQWTDFQ